MSKENPLWCYCLTVAELQFNDKMRSPGKHDQSADYTPAQSLPSYCNMSGRDEEGLHQCFKVVIS